MTSCCTLLIHRSRIRGQRAALRFGLGGHIADQLLVGRQSLPTGALQAALRREVGIHYHEVLCHHIVPDGLEQKAFATAVFSHDEAEGRASVGNDVHIPQQGVNFVLPPHGDVGQANAGNDAAFQGSLSAPEQFFLVFSWMNHLFQIRNIVFDQFRRVVAQQNGIGKGVVQFVVDAVSTRTDSISPEDRTQP